jgi:hypothetical protein
MIPLHQPSESDSYGEQQLYYFLKNKLPNDFTVIHSVPWLCAAVKQLDPKVAPTGQIDFLVIHAELGVLVLEVKSGKYKIEETAFVHIKTGNRQDAVLQTRKNAHGLTKWLGVNPNLHVTMGYAIVFPDSNFGEKIVSAALNDISVNPPESIIIDKLNFSNISARIYEIMSYWKKALKNSDLTRVKANAIVNALCPKYDGTPNWASRVEYDQKIWLKLTQEQLDVVNTAMINQRLIINGWPGTGKTIIAIELARRFMLSGKKVLFLTFNSMLVNYLMLELKPQHGSSVLNWHNLCGEARKRLKISLKRSPDWLENGCVEDLKAAIYKDLMDEYDVLILDETQVFRLDWCNVLEKWFHKNKIFAFCDETQVFSFEKNRIQINELCKLLNVKETFKLTQVLRSPRAILNRLLEVKSVNHQLLSPREFESDAISEKLVINTDNYFKDIIQKLRDENISSKDIVVLSKLGWSTNENDLELYTTVAKFRGMEAAVVVIVDAHLMDDAELFSAYSRATSRCIAIYDLEEVAWQKDSLFQKTLTQFDENKILVDQVLIDSSSQYLIKDLKGCIDFELNTIKLTWSPSWGAWLIELKNINDISELWIDYLVAYQDWPVYRWFQKSRKEVGYFDILENILVEPMRNMEHLMLKLCLDCDQLTPHRNSLNVHACVFCNNLVNSNYINPSIELKNEIIKYDLILQKIEKLVLSDEEKKCLPIPLVAFGARKHALTRQKRNYVAELHLNSGSVILRSILAHIYARLTNLKDGKIESEKLIIDIYHKYNLEKFLTLSLFQQRIGNVIASCTNRKLIKKIKIGLYEPSEQYLK